MADQDIERAADLAARPQVRATIPLTVAGVLAQNEEGDNDE